MTATTKTHAERHVMLIPDAIRALVNAGLSHEKKGT
jgi:hypothetical protein